MTVGVGAGAETMKRPPKCGKRVPFIARFTRLEVKRLTLAVSQNKNLDIMTSIYTNMSSCHPYF